ncbi:MAG TPA: hypothetical protein VMH81_15815 [Bryobacteraceae bacterium]|nr:hypothetical protein [Bryobacteraceae bacterium]
MFTGTRTTRRTLLAGWTAAVFLRGFQRDRRHLAPVDESDQDASFRDFRGKLLAVIGSKDVRQLLALVAPDVRIEFGGNKGREEFRKAWELDHPATSHVWDELGNSVRLGCVRDPQNPSGFVAPYVYARFPEDLDGVTHLVVVTPDAKLQERPEAAARVVETLHWEIVEVIGQDDRQHGWRHVRSVAGHPGFARDSDVRSPVAYRAFFQKRNGQWLMTAFVEGD